MAAVHRVVISHEVYQALQAEAMVRESSLQDTLKTLVLGNISQEARKIVGMLSEKEHVDVKTLKPQSHKAAELSGTHKQLIKDEAKVAQIKELWSSTDLPVAEIARQIDGKRQTVDSIIKKLIAKGELAARPKTTS